MKYRTLRLGYKHLLKPLLFLRDPEQVHDGFTYLGGRLGASKLGRFITRNTFSYSNPKLSQQIHGIEFKNPIGLSAGFDKNASLTQILPEVGFGFTQVGSVTLNSYEGNPKPRLYRLKKSSGLVVYYGLKNIGADKIIKKIQNLGTHKFPLSISIAKTNASYTATEDAGIKDYTECLEKFVAANVGDMYTINISCPNTFGGEPFTTPAKLDKLLNSLNKVQSSKPIFVKMPVDLAWEDFKQLVDVILDHNIQGVIIGNLTKNRESDLIIDQIPEHIKGGISGKPTQQICDDLIAKTYQYCGDKLTIVGVGGIFNAEDAYRKIKLGASLVQLITGMIFEGPGLIGEINRDLVKLLEGEGFTNISEAIGSDSIAKKQ